MRKVLNWVKYNTIPILVSYRCQQQLSYIFYVTMSWVNQCCKEVNRYIWTVGQLRYPWSTAAISRDVILALNSPIPMPYITAGIIITWFRGCYLYTDLRMDMLSDNLSKVCDVPGKWTRYMIFWAWFRCRAKDKVAKAYLYSTNVWLCIPRKPSDWMGMKFTTKLNQVGTHWTPLDWLHPVDQWPVIRPLPPLECCKLTSMHY